MSDDRERYRRIADEFGRRVAAVPADRWDDPAPCDGWVARDIIRHLVEWVPGFMGAHAAVETPPGPDVDDDPVGAWATLDQVIRTWFSDPAIATRDIDGPMGTMTVGEAINSFVTPDVLIHTWDLARAAGLDDRLERDEIAGMVDGMEPFDAQLRASGHYGPRITVADDADEQDRLLAFLGRDPQWSAPRTS